MPFHFNSFSSSNIVLISSSSSEDEEVATTTSDEAAAMKANKASSHNSRRLAEPRFADEDYIVFCFGEDGKIHMINNDTISTSTAITAKVSSYIIH